MMPQIFGEPFYPMGVPLPPAKVVINDDCIADIFKRYASGKANNKNDEELLKEYVVYYINAPVWRELEELRRKPLLLMSLKDAIYECLEYGIDPF